MLSDVSVDSDGAIILHGEYRDKMILEVMLALHCSVALARVYLKKNGWDVRQAVLEGQNA